ncbi:sterol desaturase family protein [Duganella sp. sic0402]|uniref:sterol desaturase family protein n=1 Tax=Duganella sp. sic0402 TaxID=2854786 RepID=UPI001C460ED2|nr:sterol desaturase family protein [Duganella sp. sic0402]MBV7536300.1 sterol desaturase family protein [Duganella sp. sic0402]
MMAFFSDWLGLIQGWLFETVIQPLVFQLGFGEHVEEAFEGTEWLLIGVLELALLFLVLRPLESLIPAQAITDRRARWNDFIYTVLHRIGVFSLLIFFTLDPLMDSIAAWLRFESFQPFNLESLWPGIGPLAAFAVYFVVLDFCDYWYHRASHRFNWWWALHGLHHSQQNMNLWSDDRNHVLDDLLRDVYMGVIALCIGVEPAQYVLLVSVSRILQSLQHANVRVHFGWIGERLLVSPRYHRMHHAIGFGHENADGKLGGCNFAVLLPVWDILFRTANFTPAFVATGIRDQLAGREYGEGFWSQQVLGVKRMIEYARKDVV